MAGRCTCHRQLEPILGVELKGPQVLQTREPEGQSHSNLLEPIQGHHVPQMLDTELWNLMLALLAYELVWT